MITALTSRGHLFDLKDTVSKNGSKRFEQPPRRFVRHPTATTRFFALAFFFYHQLGKHIGILVAELGMLLLGGILTATDIGMVKFRGLSPSRLVYMMFPYQNMVMDIINAMVYKTPSIFKGFHLPLLQEIPVLFLYGASKPLQMQDQNVADFLCQHEGRSDSIGVQNAGHWLYLQQPDECFEAVRKFIESE
jgi:pimeloyl-ACP methyl ester carboxylesterase